MSRVQWWVSLAFLTWGVIRVFAGYWMHSHPAAFREAFRARGQEMVKWLAGLLLVMSFLDPAPWGWASGKVGRRIDIAEYWFLTVLILAVPFLFFANAAN
jgi:hypothetical protein